MSSTTKVLVSSILLALLNPLAGDVMLEQILAPLVFAPEDTAGDAADAVQLNKPDNKKVEYASISLDAVLDRLHEKLSMDLSEDDELLLHCTTDWKVIKIDPSKTWNVSLRNEFSPDVRGRWVAQVDIESEGSILASRQLLVDAALMREVLETRQRLERGESPGRMKGSFRAVVKNIYRERSNPIAANADISDYELVRSLPEKYLLTWNDLERRPAVRRGETVEVIVKQGNMTVSVRARSLEDGLLGDTVAVRNSVSQRELTATVVGEDLVQFYP